MDRATFFAELRKRGSGIFGTSLTQDQVSGIEAILDECIRQGADLGQTAYILSTGYGETGGRMQAVRENLNYRASQIAKHFGAHRRQGKTPEQLSGNPELLGNTVYGGEWGRINLGNTQPGDGFRFRGFSMGQITGRANTEKASRDTGLDLIGNPALLDDVRANAQLLVKWMLAGRATNLRLSQFVAGSRRDYLGARRVWGGVDAAKYVGFASAFESALTVAGYEASAPPWRPDVEPVDTPPATPDWLASLIARIVAFFTRSK